MNYTRQNAGTYQRRAYLESGEWHLYLQKDNGEHIDLPFPEEYGDYVTVEQLKADGYLIDE